MSELAIQNTSLQNERYISVKIMDKICTLYGDRGKIFIGGYSYLRWIDDIVDQGGQNKEDKLSFLNRQSQIVTGKVRNGFSEQESAFLSLPWESVHETYDQIRQHTNILIHTMIDDVNHQNLNPRNSREQRHYNWRILHSCLNIANLALNGKPLRATKEVMNIANYWNYIGTLLDLDDDMKYGMANVSFNELELDEILNIVSFDLRKSKISEIYSKKRYRTEIKKCIEGVLVNAPGFLDTDMPLLQKTLIYIYLLTRVPAKAVINGYKTMKLLNS